jgi:hypothetical protein
MEQRFAELTFITLLTEPRNDECGVDGVTVNSNDEGDVKGVTVQLSYAVIVNNYPTFKVG